MRTALLAAVSHDLRTPLAAAQAAVSCLRSGDFQLTAEDHDELLATADESLNQLTQLIASLLDVSRLQAGVLPVFPRPADLGVIITRSLDGFGPAARAIVVHGAWYVSGEIVAHFGMLGRSEGCLAVANSSLDEVLARLGPGRLIYADKA